MGQRQAVRLERPRAAIEAGQDSLHMRTRGRGSRQDGPHLATLADRLLSKPCLQSPALLWTSQAQCQRPGQLQPRRSPRTPNPELDAIPSTASRRSPFLADPRALHPSHSHRPGLDAVAVRPLWKTLLPLPFLSKLAPVGPAAPPSDSIRALFSWSRASPVRLPH